MNALLDFTGEHWVQELAAAWVLGFLLLWALVYVGARGEVDGMDALREMDARSRATEAWLEEAERDRC